MIDNGGDFKIAEFKVGMDSPSRPFLGGALRRTRPAFANFEIGSMKYC
jgi:hypothetical protein